MTSCGEPCITTSLDNYIPKALRLYEQEPLESRDRRLEEYTKRWLRWTTAGL